MFVTHYKNAVLARTLRPVALGAAILCFGVMSGLSGVSFAGVAESSLPQTLPDGGPNLTESWMRTGGARQLQCVRRAVPGTEILGGEMPGIAGDLGQIGVHIARADAVHLAIVTAPAKQLLSHPLHRQLQHQCMVR